MGELHHASLSLSLLATVLIAAAALTTLVSLVAPAGGRRSIGALVPPSVDVARATDLAMWGAAGFLAGALVARAVEAGRAPYANLWEYFLALSFAILMANLFIEWIWGKTALRPVVLVIALCVLLAGNLAFSSEFDPLVPALRNSELLALHVAAMIVAYGFMAVAFGAAVAHLATLHGGQRRWLPSPVLAEQMTHRAILAGFPILGLGIVLGAYWGNIAWGRYWGWDPKETTALISWLVYAGYMHARSLRGWRGEPAAWLAVAGFGVILFNIFAVNFVISGLHSYA